MIVSVTLLATAAELQKQTTVMNLLVRYWGFGPLLDAEEKEALLAALDIENKILRGPTHLRALERLKDMGID